MPYALLIFISVMALAASAGAQDTLFRGYPCTQDCSGHKAGYEWAQRKHILDRAECGGKSQSFIEGCHAAVDELALDPSQIEPAAGAEETNISNPADPDVSEEPFAEKPFLNDPFAPDTMPGMNSSGF